MAKSHIIRALLTVGVLGAALGGLLYSRYLHDIERARERIATGSQLADTPCGPIEYAVTGDGPPLLIVHGAGGGFDQGLDFSRPLVASGFRIIAMSRFGYLRTPLPNDASAAAQADAHACLLDALNIRRAAIIGASAGAPSSMQFALRHPGRITALVLLVPVAYVPRDDGAAPMQTPTGAVFLFETVLKSDFLFWAATSFARETMVRAIIATPPAVVANAGADEQARIDEVLAHTLPVSPRRLGLTNDARVIASLQRYELERIAVPTLAISLQDDLYGTFAGARYTVEHIPRARFIGYPSGGHLWVGHQKEVVAEIVTFLKSNR